MKEKTYPAISIGVINVTTGKTMYDWSIYTNNTPGFPPMVLTLCTDGYLIYSCGGIEPGTEMVITDNDSGRKLKTLRTVDSAPCIYEDVLAMLKRNGYDYTPIKAFCSRPSGNHKIRTAYSLK